MADQNDYARCAGTSDIKRLEGVAEFEAPEPFVAHPCKVLDDPTLSADQKRSTLEDWLSDVHAVPDAPRWRQLDNGAFVDVYDLREALRMLDDAED
jgi:hypothetical protein